MYKIRESNQSEVVYLSDLRCGSGRGPDTREVVEAVVHYSRPESRLVIDQELRLLVELVIWCVKALLAIVLVELRLRVRNLTDEVLVH